MEEVYYLGMQTTTTLSDEAKLVLDFIGRGYVLRVQQGEGTGTLKYPSTRPQIPDAPKPMKSVSEEAVLELLRAPGLMWKLEKERKQQRIGWEELGLDGHFANFYVMTQ